MDSITKNETFDLSRFGHELKSYFQDKRKELIPYSLSTIVMVALFSIGNLWHTSDRDFSVLALTAIIYFIILCLCVGISSHAFVKLDSVNGALAELTTPSSQLEKFLARWLVSIALPLAFCIVMIKGVEVVAMKAITIYYTQVFPIEAFYLDSLKMAYSFTASWLIATVWLQAIFFLGSVGWKKYSQLKTLAVMILMAILVVVVCGGYMPWLKFTYHRTLTILLVTIIPLCLYYASWVLYRRAQVK